LTLKILCPTSALSASLFYLTLDGYLVGVDKYTGEQTYTLEFSPRPFILSDPTRLVGGYYIAADQENSVLFVSLGDSLQIFAIQFDRVQ
jgi:hypothetical protein